MSDLIGTLFKLGKMAVGVVRDMERSKEETAGILRAHEGVEGERIAFQQTAAYVNPDSWDRPLGLLVLTDRRLVFLPKYKPGFYGIPVKCEGFLDFPLENLYHVRAKRYLHITPAVEFGFDGKDHIFTLSAGLGIAKMQKAEELAAEIKRRASAASERAFLAGGHPPDSTRAASAEKATPAPDQEATPAASAEKAVLANTKSPITNTKGALTGGRA